MSLPNMEKIESSIVLLSGTETSLNLTGEALSKVVRDPVVQGVGQPGQTPVRINVTSLPDQIVITLVEDRFIFEDKSDDSPSTGKLPDAVHRFINMLAEQEAATFRAYGLNFKLAFDARGDNSASEVIAEKYVDVDTLNGRGGISVRGAGLRLYYEHSSGAQCDLMVEPMGKFDAPRFSAKVNYHFDLPDEKMPPPETVKTSYLGLWPQFQELLEKLFVK